MNSAIFAVAKTVTGFVASASVGSVVGNVIRTTTPGKLKGYQKVLTGVGAAVISMAVGDIAAKHVEQQIDSTAETISTIRSASVAAKELLNKES